MKSKFILVIFYFAVLPFIMLGQGRNNNWLIGYDSGTSPFTTCERATISFNNGNSIIQPQFNRKMNFSSTEANISSKGGYLIMSSNGVWIANAYGDTMLNGKGLNPGPMVNSSSSHCLNMINANLVIPFPGDSNKLILFHTVGNYNASLSATELYYTVIDLTLDNGLGGVVLKNQIAFQDTLMWSISACKHGNGRDWWILMVKNNSDLIYKVLVTPNGIERVTSQNVGGIKNYNLSIGQSVFSPNGKKFAYSSAYIDTTGSFHFVTDIRLFDFDRCSGLLVNYRNYSTSNFYSAVGACFSQNSKYLYAATTNNIFQINSDIGNPSVDTVAVNDGNFSPISPFQTDFYIMYLAIDGKIYVTSGNGVNDIHFINYPDSAGIACDIHQHALHLPCFNWRSIPNHPNYELGADSGSVCDSLQLAIKSLEIRKQKSIIQIKPYPAEDYFYINYDLNVRDNALFILYDSFGHEVLRRNLYGTMKTLLVNCEELLNGVYFYTSTVRNKVVDKGEVVVVK